MKLMFVGKTHATLNLLSEGGRGTPLHLDQPAESTYNSRVTVREVLKEKHPVCTNSLNHGSPPESHSVIFENIDAALIRSVPLCTSGAAGLSSPDAFVWKKLCTSFTKSLV